jgi:hypothetical protein
MGAKTELFARHQPGGVFTITNEKMTTGEMFFVCSVTGTDAAGGGNNPDAPLATLDYAIGLCTASKGDQIILMPGHAETTTAIALDKAGVKILGLGYGRNRPTLTATTDATDLLNVTAANCELENVRLVGAASGVTALVDLSSAAADFAAINCTFEQAATPLSCITISAAERFRFSGCTFIGTSNGPDRVFSIEVGCDNWVIEDCKFLYPLGIDNELIKSVATCVGYVIENVTVVGIDTLLVNFSSSSAGINGLFASGHIQASAALTSIEDMVAAGTSKGMRFGRVYAADVTGAASGLIPITTAS